MSFNAFRENKFVRGNFRIYSMTTDVNKFNLAKDIKINFKFYKEGYIAWNRLSYMHYAIYMTTHLQTKLF